ncbi:MAG: HupE/UreJ family protein [Acidobacteriota bacterium]|nr:HupE/UreJ family protein [Acidobacteriota bacterium]
MPLRLDGLRSRSPSRSGRVALALLAILAGTPALRAHEAERTRVLLTFTGDERFVLEVANDPLWMLLRLETFAGGTVPPNPTAAQRDARLAQLTAVFADRIVLFVDGHEVRAESVAYQPPPTSPPDALARFTLTGRMPRGASTLRWLYGIVADPYPLEIRQADGSSTVEWITGTNWSGVIDLTRSFPQPTRWQIARQYLALGYTHILPKGLDHILFVLGLFLLSPRVKTLLLQVTAFTLAHSITLGLSIYGLVSLPSRLVEPLIALSIAYVAIENLVTRKLKPWRLALVFAFGLLHGLGFAGVLRELGLPRGEFLTGLLAFNVGVEGGQLTVIAIAMLLVWPFVNRGWYRHRVVIPASLVIAAIGLYWTVTRVIAG